MRTFLALLAIALAAVGVPASAGADDPVAPPPPAAASDGFVPPSCDDPDLSTLAAADCTGAEPVPSLDPDYAANPPTVRQLLAAGTAALAAQPGPAQLPAYCRIHANIYFYTSSDWVRLGQYLQANASPCADYYISIPPLAADKTGLRCAQDDLIRALGPRFHPVVEFHFAGWNAWWKNNNKTPADAAHAFLAKVRDCGYDFTTGETWSLNEMHSGIRRNLAGARDNMRQLLNTLHAGLPEMPASKGIVWVIGIGQNTVNVSDYHPQLEEWLQDTPYWEDMARDVAVWGQEAYPDMRYWGVADTSRNDRTRNVNLFLEHPMLLAENAPPTASTALDFLERTYVPLASAAWPYTTGFGNTSFSDDQMKRFVSEQGFAVKHFSQSRPHRAPGASFAMAWAPNSACGSALCTPAKAFAERTAGILERLASGIREAYEKGGGSQTGWCGPPGDHSWCDADIPGADFNPLWLTFANW